MQISLQTSEIYQVHYTKLTKHLKPVVYFLCFSSVFFILLIQFQFSCLLNSVLVPSIPFDLFLYIHISLSSSMNSPSYPPFDHDSHIEGAFTGVEIDVNQQASYKIDET